MSPAEPATLRRSALHDAHVELGAKLTEFGGWEMPLAYRAGTIAEHKACRSDTALFDVSHLGTVRVEGAQAFDSLQGTLTNDLARIEPGRAQYTHLLEPDGSVLDDMLVWWLDDERFDVMPNASNTERVLSVVSGTDVTEDRCVIAVQGPEARARLATVSPEAAAVGRFRVAGIEWRGVPMTVAGTGYTGEDGVECAVPAEAAASLWRALLDAGATPAGLGARDTLRLEAGLPLHGHELGKGITPLQAGLSWVVGWDKERFIGRDALVAERAAGVRRSLRGLVAEGRQPPREPSAVVHEGATVGRVTSGNFSPMLEVGIALALVDTDAGLTRGDPVTVDQRGRELACIVHPLPLWKPKGT
ncbi:MAG: glycine cleavage system aminomethyltransferase GcvT [Acidimicrobiales bacterium]